MSDVQRALTVVVAGNYRQFVDWCQRQGIDPRDKSYRYVGRPEDLRGLRDYAVQEVGTWNERYDTEAQELRDYLAHDWRTGRRP